MKKLFLLAALASLCGSLMLFSCNSKPKDADIKSAIEKALASHPDLTGLGVTVEKGIATLTGQCKDEACKVRTADLVKAIAGVKEVVNNITVAPPAPVQITPDDPLKQAVKDAIASYPDVTAVVENGVITLTGTIAKADRQKLMMALSALKPKKIDPSGLKNK
ncbi:MAG: BON domain-containing protein [Chitinophagales bacterium]|nr:BON domain-containing protein [Chitinophagales bacterium]MDW8417771.1 BON domain-containing protein [Chitinophagales bacterium]